MHRKPSNDSVRVTTSEPAPVDWKSLGHEFKTVRESKGLTLEQIALETRIGTSYLTAIETGRLSVFPSAFYQKAFFRAYARRLGVSEDRIRNWSRLTDECSEASVPLMRDRFLDRHAILTPRSVFLALGFVIVAALLTFRALDSTASAPPMREAFVTRALSKASKDLPFVREELGVASGPERPVLEIVLRVEQSCWLSVRSDGIVVSEGLMLPGDEKQFRARDDVRLSVGNAGGIALWINGHRAKPLGRRGVVLKNLLITPENFRELVAP